ncbi:conjugal transfer protein TraF [uncultured Helicobacter sp.]|uniref:conjugal transfer protein TraF n=7 Tax=uncultured Helicobacter sp. TaxID=175537 RepID=UPI0025DCE29D|nr:conjugal transfer protein TraF [uncultured Helicobacter sp.]
MNRVYKKIGSGTMLLAPLLSCAVEFGGQGIRSAALGGAGVALKQTQWGLYYNPALLAAEPAKHAKVGWNVGATLMDSGLFTMFDDSILEQDTIKNTQSLNEALNRGANLTFQSGIVFQLLPISQGHNLSIGYFKNIYTSLSGWGNIPDNSTNLNDVTDNAGFDAHLLAIDELPIGYAYRFSTSAGEISMGASVKFMFGAGGRHSMDLNGNITDLIKDTLSVENAASSFNVGLDLGAYYSPNIINNRLGIGLVVKNLNAPSFTMKHISNGVSTNEKISLNPQVRLGMSLDPLDWLTFTFDADLTSNKLLPLASKTVHSQVVGGGMRFHSTRFENVDLNLGIAKDFGLDNGLTFSGGFGLGLIGIALSYSTGKTDMGGVAIPNYVAIKIGGGLNF